MLPLHIHICMYVHIFKSLKVAKRKLLTAYLPKLEFPAKYTCIYLFILTKCGTRVCIYIRVCICVSALCNNNSSNAKLINIKTLNNVLNCCSTLSHTHTYMLAFIKIYIHTYIHTYGNYNLEPIIIYTNNFYRPPQPPPILMHQLQVKKALRLK